MGGAILPFTISFSRMKGSFRMHILLRNLFLLGEILPKREIKYLKMKWIWRFSITKREREREKKKKEKTHHFSIIGFQCLAKKFKRRFKFFSLHIWWFIARFGYILPRMITNFFRSSYMDDLSTLATKTNSWKKYWPLAP